MRSIVDRLSQRLSILTGLAVMSDTPVFQGHHIIEQQAFRDSLLLRKLSDHGLFDLDGPRNMLNLPADRALAGQLGLSPVQQQTRDATGQVAPDPRLV